MNDLPSSQSRVAAILVGGKGTRLRSVITDLPKPLAPIAGEPFLYIILRYLAAQGVKKVVLLTGYQHEKIVSACGDGSQFNLEIVYSREMEPLGTAGAIRNARFFLQDYADFLLLNGDTYRECSLRKFLVFPLETRWMGLVGATYSSEDTARFGSLQIHPHTWQIEAFLEKDTASTGLINAGIYRLSTAILDKIPEQKFCSLEREIFPQLIQQTPGLRAFCLPGKFFDIGTPESYTALNQYRLLKNEG